MPSSPLVTRSFVGPEEVLWLGPTNDALLVAWGDGQIDKYSLAGRYLASTSIDIPAATAKRDICFNEDSSLIVMCFVDFAQLVSTEDLENRAMVPGLYTCVGGSDGRAFLSADDGAMGYSIKNVSLGRSDDPGGETAFHKVAGMPLRLFSGRGVLVTWARDPFAAPEYSGVNADGSVLWTIRDGINDPLLGDDAVFSNDLLALRSGRSVAFFQVADGTAVGSATLDHHDRVLAISPDGKRVVLWNPNASHRLLDRTDNSSIPLGQPSSAHDVVFEDNGNALWSMPRFHRVTLAPHMESGRAAYCSFDSRNGSTINKYIVSDGVQYSQWKLCKAPAAVEILP